MILNLFLYSVCSGSWAQVWRGSWAVWHPEGGGHDTYIGPDQRRPKHPSQHHSGLRDPGLVLALGCGSGAEHRVHTRFSCGLRWGRGMGRCDLVGRRRRWRRRSDNEVCRPICYSDAGKETYCGFNWTGVELCSHPGAEPAAAFQHTADRLLCHQYGPQWQGEPVCLRRNWLINWNVD